MSNDEYELWDRDILNTEAKAMSKDLDRMYKENEQLRESLVKSDIENRELKHKLYGYLDYVTDLIKAREELREALKNCSPEYFDGFVTRCKFCKNSMFHHHNADCQYIRLIGGE